MIGNYDWTISNRKKLNRRTHVSLLMAAIAEICFHRDLRRSKRNGNRWCLLSDAYLASARIYATAVFSHSNNGNNLRPGICYRNATGNPFPFATPLIPSVEYPFSFLSFSPFSLSLSPFFVSCSLLPLEAQAEDLFIIHFFPFFRCSIMGVTRLNRRMLTPSREASSSSNNNR